MEDVCFDSFNLTCFERGRERAEKDVELNKNQLKKRKKKWTCSLVQHLTMHILSLKPLLNKHKSYSFCQISYKKLNTYTN